MSRTTPVPLHLAHLARNSKRDPFKQAIDRRTNQPRDVGRRDRCLAIALKWMRPSIDPAAGEGI
jgi:hypothetical protein